MEKSAEKAVNTKQPKETKQPEKAKQPKKVSQAKATVITVIVFLVIVALCILTDYVVKKPDLYRYTDFPKDKAIVEIDFSYQGTDYKLTEKDDIKDFTNILKGVGLTEVKDTASVPAASETYEFDVRTAGNTVPLVFNGDYISIGTQTFKAKSNVITDLYDVYVAAYK